MTYCVCGQFPQKRNPPPLSVHVTANRHDPTRTLMLRNQFAKDLRSRFRKLRGVIRRALVDEDVLGLSPEVFADMFPPGRKAFDFPRSQDKVTAFMDWFQEQEQRGILEVTERTQLGQAVEEAWTNKYIHSAYQRGVLRGRQELVKAKFDVPSIGQSGGIEAAFNQPFHLDRVGLMYARAFSDLRGITAAMDSQVSRVLAQGMADGRSPRELARLLNRTITGPSGDLGLTDTLGRFIPAQRRALVLARTEVIRAHHMATVQEYRNWEVVGVMVRAEWRTAGDKRVCLECQALEGKVFSLEEIEGMIPLHAQCRCISIPAPVERKPKKITKRAI